MMYNIHSGAIKWEIHDFLCDGGSVCSLSLFARYLQNKKNAKTDIEYEGHGQGVLYQDLRHSTGNVRIHIGDFFRILTTWEHMYMQ